MLQGSVQPGGSFAGSVGWASGLDMLAVPSPAENH